MFDDSLLKEPNIIAEIENPPSLVNVDGEGKILFNDKFTTEHRVRCYIYDLLLKAQESLPAGYRFVVYEALRPRSKQIELWNDVVEKMKKEYPHLSPDSEEFIAKCDVYAANPYRQGSGHQSGAAVDITLCNNEGVEYDMGSFVRDFSSNARSDNTNLSAEALKNRQILDKALTGVGLVNYPPEWWHYSFGDRLWARLTKSDLAIFASIE